MPDFLICQLVFSVFLFGHDGISLGRINIYLIINFLNVALELQYPHAE